jgi:hypothetical protein
VVWVGLVEMLCPPTELVALVGSAAMPAALVPAAMVVPV